MLRYSHQQKKTKQKQKAKHKNIAINQVVRAKQAKLKKRKHKIKNKTWQIKNVNPRCTIIVIRIGCVGFVRVLGALNW